MGYIDDTCSWLTISPAILFLVGLCFVPPSPRYLATTGKPHTSKKLLQVHRLNNRATILTDVENWMGSKDVIGFSKFWVQTKYLKLCLPVLGLSLLEVSLGPVVILFYLQEICYYISKALG